MAAAAFAALVSLKHNLYLIQTHPRHSFHFEEEQIKSLWGSVCFLTYFMKSNDNSQGPRREATEALERRIACAAQAAEDVIESHVVDQIRSGKTRRSKTTSSSRFLLDLQKVIEAMDFMRRKAFNVYARGAQSGVEAEQQPTYSAAPLTSNKTDTVGFHGVLVLLDLLTGVSPSRRVIPIVGMGGIGKTTIAKSAFEHPLIVERFDICLWATISQKYKVQKILAQLLSIDEYTSGTVDVLGERLYKSLCGKRYLIVLDDMWSLQAWDEINFFFPTTNNESQIVVTSRHSDVAKGLTSLYLAMRCLGANNSWDLFCQKAFAEQGCPPELEEIGKKIVEKCKGLPLAIVVVGGHLKKSSRALQYWENVAHNMNSILDSTDNEEQCLNVLCLSYSYLPVHLKPCFLLLGAFPEDQSIYAMDVIRIWIAEGFIEPSSNSSLEEVAQYYLQDLFDRNLLFLAGTMDYNEEIYLFKLHDIVRELCLKIAKREEFLCVLDDPRGAIKWERRVVINGEVPEVNHQTKTSDAPIRCLIYEGDQLSSYNLRLLRTLTKVVTSSSTSESMFQQVNLRYLKVDLIHMRSRILYLPSSISLLWNLQILTITVPDQSKVIAPYEIWEMLQLRHLEVEPICLLDPLPVDRSNDAANDDLVLRHLEKLTEVENFRLSEEVCRRIPNVKELRLSYCDEPNLYYCPHNLRYFHELQFLVCKFDRDSTWHDFAVCLTFPISLKELHLSGCGLYWEEVTMLGSLPNLVSLRLYPNSVIGSVWTPAEGKFLSLRNLDIWGNDDLVCWNADTIHFPVLQNVYLKSLSKLDEFPSGIGEIPTLRWIELVYCNVSLTISAMRTLVEQEEQGNEDLRLEVCFRGDEETLESFKDQVEEEGLTSKNLSLSLQH